MNTNSFKARVTGPIVSINTPFLKSGDIDYDGLANFIDYSIDAGSKCVLFTPGDSLYCVLTDDEVFELTKFAGEQIKDRAMYLASADCWSTDKTESFARFAKEAGADATLVFPPNRGSTVHDMVDYFKAVSEHLPVFLLSASLAPLGVKGALETVKILLDEAPNIVGLKEDYGPEFIRPACLLAHEKWAIFAGGQKQTHMDMVPYGVDGYMSIFMTFKPEISQRYWAAIENNDLTAATLVIRDYDMPTIDFLYSQFPAGGDAAQHGMLELAGICQRWRRQPLSDLSDEEMEKLRGFFQDLGLL
jgi:4-hydroxy-tetrahydrodipicolinate synthase